MRQNIKFIAGFITSMSLAGIQSAYPGIDVCRNHLTPVPYFFDGDKHCPECVQRPDDITLKVHAKTWNRAALNVFQKIARKPGANEVISTHSINEAVSMLTAGAAGSSLDYTTKLMGTNPEEFYQFKQLLNVGESAEGDVFTRYNLLAISNSHRVQEKYIDFVQYDFDKKADVRKDVDFCDPEGLKALAADVNGKVCRVTQGLIDSCIDPAELQTLNTAVVLSNTTHFGGKWAVKFTEEPGMFHLADGNLIQITMIKTNNTHHHSYASLSADSGNGQWQAVSIPYNGRFEMVAVLPPDTESLNNIPSAQFETLLLSLRKDPELVEVTLPEYMLSIEYDLADVLKGDEGADIFDPDKANLSEMLENPDGVWVEKLTHKVVIKTDKDGTVASGRTTAVVVSKGMVKSTRINFDRPFLFVIRDKERQAIRFIGKLTNPSKED